MVRSTAWRRLIWPRIMLSHEGVHESSKSAMKVEAPELSALMTILRSTGPVISTRRSCRSAGTGATVHALSRIERVSGRKPNVSPASRRAWRSARAFIRSRRRCSYLRCRCATKPIAWGVRMRSYRFGWCGGTWMPGMWKLSRFMACSLIGCGGLFLADRRGFGEELLVLGRPMQRRRGRLARLDHLRHVVEIAGADFPLVLDRGEAALGRGELLLLQLDEGGHVVARVAVGEVEHAVVQRMEAGERDELELVSHGAQLALEPGDGRAVEVLLPVERRRAVVGEHLAGVHLLHAFGEAAREVEVGRAGLAPH